MDSGCKYCKHNRFDGVNQGSNICGRYLDHIDPYDDRYCDEFEPSNSFPPEVEEVTDYSGYPVKDKDDED